jgi:hypothetical protein
MRKHWLALALLPIGGCTVAGSAGITSAASQIGSTPDAVCVGILGQSAANLANLRALLNGTVPPPIATTPSAPVSAPTTTAPTTLPTGPTTNG